MKSTSCVIMLIVFISLSVYAHKPIFDDELHNSFKTALEIQSPQVSQITYHEFTAKEPVFWVKFIAEKGEAIKIVLTTPYHEKYADFNLYMTLFSEKGRVSLKENDGVRNSLTFTFPEGYDYLTVNSKDYENRFFHEPFSNTDSWFLLTDYILPEETGWHYIALYPVEGFEDSGKVGFSIGVLERFLPLDLFMLGSWIEQIRLFHEE